MTTVTLVHKHSGFANIPDSYKITDPNNPYIWDEFSQSVETYQLPAGYSWSQGNDGGLYIYNPTGDHCDIVPHTSNGRPQLFDGSKHSPVLIPILTNAQ